VSTFDAYGRINVETKNVLISCITIPFNL